MQQQCRCLLAPETEGLASLHLRSHADAVATRHIAEKEEQEEQLALGVSLPRWTRHARDIGTQRRR